MPKLVKLLIAVTTLWITCEAPARGADGTGPGAVKIRETACKPLQADFDKVLAAHAHDAAAKSILQRLLALDAATDAILQDLQVHSGAFLDRNLATINDIDLHGAGTTRKPIGSAKIIEKFRASLSAPIPFAALSNTDRKTVDAYYLQATQSLTEYVQRRGKSVVSAIGVDASEIAKLCFVLPLLTSTDQPLSGEFPLFPAWMNRPEYVRLFTETAIADGYPRLAFSLSRKPASAPAIPSSSLAGLYVVFVRPAADGMFRVRNYKAGLACLRDGITVAEAAKLEKQRAELRFQLAEVLEATGSAQTAADEMSGIMSGGVDFGRASMLRLKYLYAAEQIPVVIKEASEYQKDDRCTAYLPQIIYIAWVASRRDGGTAEEPWRKSFLEKFPEHPLAADIYFASAMDSLAASKYDEAERVLTFIEYRFPDSKIIDRVRNIHQRLAECMVLRPVRRP